MATRANDGSARGGVFAPGRDGWWGLGLVAAVVIAYLPVGRAGFIWDDEAVVTANPCVVGPLGLKEIWTTKAADICPLTISTFWLEHKLWGLAPLPYHVVNVLLHGGCAVALWRVLLRLEIRGAWFGAALWALHPVMVESVAWVTEMKNTESGLFYLLAILFFLRGGARGDYGLSLLFAALAMMSKSSTVILPVVLLLGAWWRGGRWTWREAARVGPMFAFSILAAVVSIWTQKLSGADNPLWTQTWPQRIASAGDAVWFYLGKLAWPQPLILVYPRWQIDAGSVISYGPVLGVVMVSAGLWLGRGTWGRAWLFAWGYFLVALLPVLGFVNMSYQGHSLVADHFQYLAAMGPLALAGGGAARLAEGVSAGRWLVGGGVLLGALGAVSFDRSRVFVSDEKVWSDTVAKNPGSWAAHNNLGHLWIDRGDIVPAIGQARLSLAINPYSADAYNILGIAFEKQGLAEESLAQFEKMVTLDPNNTQAYTNIGAYQAQRHDYTEAIANYRKALETNPAYVIAYNDLGVALLAEGKVGEAIATYQEALRINPQYAEAWNNLGNAYLRERRVDEALVMYRRALEGKPAYADAHNDLGFALLHLRRLPEATAELRKAVELAPDNAGARNNLGIALAMAGAVDQAEVQFAEAVRLQPTFAEAQKNLARARAELSAGGKK